jgi:hypothetical protein
MIDKKRGLKMTELENKIVELVTDNWRDKEVETNLTKLRLMLKQYYGARK